MHRLFYISFSRVIKKICHIRIRKMSELLMKVPETMIAFISLAILSFTNVSHIYCQESNTTPWRITIQATHGSDTPKDRTFGVEQGGTDGYDNSLDLVSPPAPQSWYTYFYISSFPNSLQKDIRDNAVAERNRGLGNAWRYVILNAGYDATVLSWDASSFPQGSYSPGALELRNEADELVADILANTSVSVSGDQNLYVWYRAPQNISSGIDEVSRNHFENFFLCQNYPNPFNSETVIRYYIGTPSHIRLSLFNLLGQEVRVLLDEALFSGWHSVRWDGSDDSGFKLPSGLYIVRLQADTGVDTRTIQFIQ